jgi:CheY-like chemotaxis protein
VAPVAEEVVAAAVVERPTVTIERPATASDGHRILVVDDNEDAAEASAMVLTAFGHDVKVAHDGPSALKIAQSFKPSLCLLDIGLPVMDGYELARRLREIPDMPADLRLIAITGYGQDADRQRSIAAGFHSHVVKPVDIDVLERVVSS